MAKKQGVPKVVKVTDLKDQTGVPGPHPSLHCDVCWADYSANAGDYFWHPKDHVFTCCGEPMRLAHRVVSYVDVD